MSKKNFFKGLKFHYRFNDKEKHERDNKKVKYRADKRAPVDVYRLRKVESGRSRAGFVKNVSRFEYGINLREIRSSAYRCYYPVDNRAENVVAERVHDSGKRAADDNAYGKVHNVAAGYEFFEFRKELFHNRKTPYVILNTL